MNDPKSIAFSDIERELKVTRDVLAALPAANLEWKTHAKSMSIGALASHVADMPAWMRGTLVSDELDFANAPRSPGAPFSKDEILARFDRQAAELRTAIAGFDMSRWFGTWTMRNGAQVIVAKDRPTAFRVWSANHMVHHRAQLCVYLRLLDLPVPTVYFNTADDKMMKFE